MTQTIGHNLLISCLVFSWKCFYFRVISQGE